MAASPFVVDITPLKRQPGVQRPFDPTLAPPDGMALATAEVRATELGFDLQLEVAGEELIAQGTIDIGWTGPCRRCLEDQHEVDAVEVREIFQKVPVEGETYFLDKDQVDLEPMVREVVLLHLPVAPLCREDCAGPDPDRYATSVVSDEEPDDDGEAPIDPRWAALSELTFDD
ncbi:MAG: DUF177 domain-containing protein [Actinomycetota bacterium]